MALLALQRLMSMLISTEGSTCQQDGDADPHQAAGTIGCSIPYLPEDIWHHIHSLMPLRDAARAACLSRAFLHSWRCRPNLTFNQRVFSPKSSGYSRDFSHNVDCIMRNHSGTGVKILRFELLGTTNHNLNSWLQVAVKPGIEELTLKQCMFKSEYEFPCSLLSNGARNSIRYLELGFCTFRPTDELGPLPNLTSLNLLNVGITDDELEFLLSNCLALTKLKLIQCEEIVCLRIPCELQHFSCLRIRACTRLKLIETRAPNLSTLELWGKAELSLGEALQMRNLRMSRSNVVCYARAELPSIMPNLDTLELRSNAEEIDTPLLTTKFLYLKHLIISLRPRTFSWSYDYFSLVSFLVASPYLETLSMDVPVEPSTNDESVFGHSSSLRQVAGDWHCYLKNVKITGFSSEKSLVELTCYILKNAVSLECLTLDTLYGPRCSDKGSQRCNPMGDSILKGACTALLAIRTYIEDKVPASVKFTVVEPCSRCHRYEDRINKYSATPSSRTPPPPTAMPPPPTATPPRYRLSVRVSPVSGHATLLSLSRRPLILPSSTVY